MIIPYISHVMKCGLLFNFINNTRNAQSEATRRLDSDDEGGRFGATGNVYLGAIKILLYLNATDIGNITGHLLHI